MLKAEDELKRKVMEIEIPTFQEFRGSTDGPLHVAFIVHLVSQLLNFINVFKQGGSKAYQMSQMHY